MSKADELLHWYAEKAEAMARYANAKPPKTEAMMAVVTELCLDAGNRGRAYLNEKPHEPIAGQDLCKSPATGTGAPASPPHAVAEPEKPMDKARREWEAVSERDAARLDRLVADYREGIKELVRCGKLYEATEVGIIADAIVALRARAEEAERDAERYQFLRVRMGEWHHKIAHATESPSAVDSAIDAARLAEQIEKDKGG